MSGTCSKVVRPAGYRLFYGNGLLGMGDEMPEEKKIVFFENWFLMAEGRDTDEKRLAFYDALFRYAFTGVIPEKPIRGESAGKVWAAWDAYLATSSTIDNFMSKSEMGRRGGMAGTGSKKRNATSFSSARQECQTQHETARALPDDAPPVLPTKGEMKTYARQIAVPESYLQTFMKEMQDGGWGYVNRGGSFVRLNRNNFKAVLSAFYKQHKKNQASEKTATVGVNLQQDGYDAHLC